MLGEGALVLPQERGALTLHALVSKIRIRLLIWHLLVLDLWWIFILNKILIIAIDTQTLYLLEVHNAFGNDDARGGLDHAELLLMVGAAVGVVLYVVVFLSVARAYDLVVVHVA